MESGRALPGAIHASLTLDRVGVGDDGRRFTLVARNSAGLVESAEATLSVVAQGGQVVLAVDGVFGLAVSEEDVYWTDGRSVKAASMDCSGSIQALYQIGPGWENTDEVVLGGGNVIWTDTVTGAVRRVLSSGGAAETLAAGLGPSELYVIAVGGGQLYWPHSLAGIQTVPLAGGVVRTLAGSHGPGSYDTAGGIAVDGQYVYWTDMVDHSVKRIPLDGGQVTVLASNQEYPGWIVADGRSVFWANVRTLTPGAPVGEVMRVSRDGGTPTILVSQPTEVRGIAVDATHAYWTGWAVDVGAAGSDSVSRAPLDGSGPAEVLASGLHSLYSHIAVNSRFVVWVDSRGVMRLVK